MNVGIDQSGDDQMVAVVGDREVGKLGDDLGIGCDVGGEDDGVYSS